MLEYLTHCNMVTTCNVPFTEDEKYDEHFSRFPNFKLSDFQKWAIKGIVENENILITAHTGSGKTLPAEFAITHYVEQGRKVIYTSPIKALSNTKLSELRKKYPDISFGIITGDIVDNPEADVIIMTTEILRNTLFNKKIKNRIALDTVDDVNKTNNTLSSIPLAFDMDIENELAAVIFDEVHYINDADRGTVWEQSILLLPPHIQLIMLSATIDKPEVFAKWIYEQKTPKNIYLIPTSHRVVPLTHYLWITTHENTMKKMKNSDMYTKTAEIRNKPVVLKDSNGKFCDTNFYKVKALKTYLDKNRIFIKQKYLLNEFSTFMKRNNHLPAICFVFSRKKVEQCAKEISNSLFDEDSVVPNIIEDECKKIIMNKLDNYKEYINLPEYTDLITMLKKGVAIHHAGMLSVLKEMIELLFDKGYIKLLFATETFAVGINVPARSTVFTSLEKYNGYNMRNLYSHEYTQMAGRAGRRGIDSKGLVWILGNLVDMEYANECRHILTGSPQSLSSKFKISIQLCLNIISCEKSRNKIKEFTESTLMNTSIKNELIFYHNLEKGIQQDIDNKRKTINMVSGTPLGVMAEYSELKSKLGLSSNKKRKQILREIANMEDEYRTLTSDISHYNEIKDAEKNMSETQNNRSYTENYIESNITFMKDFLLHHKCIQNENGEEKITNFGKMASQIQEAHPLTIARFIIDTDYFDTFTPRDIAVVLSCFPNICVNSEQKIFTHTGFGYPIDDITSKLENLVFHYKDSEDKLVGMDCGTDFTFQKDIMRYVYDWCDADSEDSCKHIIHTMKVQSGIFLGEFVKAILKINNLVSEVENICEMMNRVDAVEKCRAISPLLLKYVVTNVSLYV